MYALLLLLSRFAGHSKSGTTKHEPSQTSWHVFMTSLLHRCFPETSEQTLVIALDAHATKHELETKHDTHASGSEATPIECLLVERRCFGRRHGTLQRQKQLKLSALTLGTGPRQLLKYFLPLRAHFEKEPDSSCCRRITCRREESAIGIHYKARRDRCLVSATGALLRAAV
eukprot:6492586-Amphidinium_carterae.2